MISDFLEFLRSHFGVISTLLALAVGVFWLKLDTRYAKKQDVYTLKDTARQHENRLMVLEDKLANLPTAVDVERLKVLVTDVKGDTKATAKQVDAMTHQIGLLIEAKLRE